MDGARGCSGIWMLSLVQQGGSCSVRFIFPCKTNLPGHSGESVKCIHLVSASQKMYRLQIISRRRPKLKRMTGLEFMVSTQEVRLRVRRYAWLLTFRKEFYPIKVANVSKSQGQATSLFFSQPRCIWRKQFTCAAYFLSTDQTSKFFKYLKIRK